MVSESPDGRAAAAAAIEQRVEAEQLRLVASQLGRVPLPLLAANLFVLWLLWRAGLEAAGIVWFVMSAPVEAWRFIVCRRELSVASPQPGTTLRRLSAGFAVASVMRAALVPFVFSVPVADTHYVFTMLYIGLAAGGVATSGGVIWAYLVFAVAVGGSVTAAWLLEGGFDGYGVGLLSALLFATLAIYVRDQARSMRQLVALAKDNETLAESLRVERDRAEAASQAKTRFFAAASHDLRQPLHALSINATTLELVAQRQANPLVTELSHSINNALSQSNSLLEGLLDISRLDAGAVKPEIGSVDAIALVSGVRDEFRPLAAQRGLSLDVDLPAGPFPVLLTDRDLLLRMLNNLVSNALKFTRQGGATLRVQKPADDSEGQWAEISVHDTGPGIAADEQPRVFEEFYQIGNPSRDRSQGLGLGLSIVQRTAQLLGIELRLDSALGVGTSVTLRVRCAAESAAVLPQKLESGPLALGLRVMVIDDEEAVVKSLLTLLPMLGCEVRGASGSAQALSAVAEGFAPDVVIVDHRLRGESGFEAVDALRKLVGELPVIMVTGDTAPANIRQAQASGFHVLHKPVDGRRLGEALAAMAGVKP